MPRSSGCIPWSPQYAPDKRSQAAASSTRATRPWANSRPPEIRRRGGGTIGAGSVAVGGIVEGPASGRGTAALAARVVSFFRRAFLMERQLWIECRLLGPRLLQDV